MTELETLHKQIDRTHDLLEQGVYDTDTFLVRSRSLVERIAAAKEDISTRTAEVQADKEHSTSRLNVIPKVERLLADER